jgi:hypothetical protein
MTSIKIIDFPGRNDSAKAFYIRILSFMQSYQHFLPNSSVPENVRCWAYL